MWKRYAGERQARKKEKSPARLESVSGREIRARPIDYFRSFSFSDARAAANRDEYPEYNDVSIE